MSDTVAPTLGAKLSVEFIGTFVLVFGGCGSAIFAAKVISDETVNMESASSVWLWSSV